MPRFSEAEFQAQDDLRALEQSEEVRASSSRMRRAKRVAQKQLKAAQKTVERVKPARRGGSRRSRR